MASMARSSTSFVLLVATSHNLGAAVLIGGAGLTMTIGSIAGIVFLARRLGGEKSAGAQIALVVGILALAGFALVGLAAAGCGAILA